MAFEDTSQGLANLNSSIDTGGSIYPTIHAGNLIRTTTEEIDSLKNEYRQIDTPCASLVLTI